MYMHCLLYGLSLFVAQDFSYWLTTPSNQMALIQSCDHLFSLGASSAPDGHPSLASPRHKDLDSSYIAIESPSELGSIHDSYFGSSHESLEMEEEENVPNLLETTVDSITEGPPLLSATHDDDDDKELEVREDGG